MMQYPTLSQIENHLILTTNHQTKQYPNDKMGKRAAILDGLQAIPTLTTGEACYLPSDAALQLVAGALYPAGIQTEETYQQVCRVTDNALAHIGYGPEVTLGPPIVPFSARGSYRQKLPSVPAELVLTELERARISTTQPRRELTCTIVWNQAGQAVHQRHWSQLTATQQEQIRRQVDQIASQAGWERESAPKECLYIQPLPVDAATARERLKHFLAREEGAPLSYSSLVYQLQIGAYGRSFYSNELPAALLALITELLPANGYAPEPVQGEYQPKPVSIDLPDLPTLTEQIAQLPTVETKMGKALLLSDLLTSTLGPGQKMSAWQEARLLQTPPLNHALKQAGYQTELTWCQPYQFTPERDNTLDAIPLLLRAIRITSDPNRTIRLADGLPVYTPALVIDDEADTLIYLEMVGAKESVKANWAALMGGNRVHWLGHRRIQMEGMKQHIQIPATLPCGWVSQVLLHKQASLKAMNPEQPFYLLDDGEQPIPLLFYPMLNKALALPLLEAWGDYLWLQGQNNNLITLLNGGQGQQYASWQVRPNRDMWQEIVQSGLQQKALTF
ncbi:MAG: hypothetical protein WAS33_13230 [Candidatus Promineifilaceae bacterium]